MNKKRWAHLFLSLSLVPSLLLGCSSNSATGSPQVNSSEQANQPVEQKLDYPKKSINLIIPWGAGGSTDSVGRSVAEAASGYLGQQVVVVNRAGASGTLGSDEAAKAKPDGYTMGLVTATTLAMQTQMKELDYSVDDFKFISSLVYNPLLLVVNGSSPYNSIKDLIEDVNKNNKSLKVGHPGVGSANDIAHSAFFKATNIKTANVPFKANSETIAAILGGHVDIAAVHPVDATEYVKDKRLKILGIFTPERIDMYPDVPTVAEQLEELGIDSKYKNHDFSAWYYLAVPTETPDEVVEFLRKNMKDALSDPAFIKVAENLKMPIRLLENDEIVTQVKDFEKTYGLMITEFNLKK